MSPLCQTHIEPHQLNQMEPSTLCTCLSAIDASWCSSSSTSRQGHLHRVRVFLFLFGQLGAHAKHYAEAMTDRFGLGPASKVMEIGSNDGYLLQHFSAQSDSRAGDRAGCQRGEGGNKQWHSDRRSLFRREQCLRTGAEHGQADLLLGNNVLAHVPDINDFVGGMKAQLKPGGVVTMEFPHLSRLMEETSTTRYITSTSPIYRSPSSSKCSRRTVSTLFDVEELPTHGGSLRIYGRHNEDIGETSWAARRRVACARTPGTVSPDSSTMNPSA